MFTPCIKKTTGITIGDYLSNLRVEQSAHLLADRYTMDYAAKECGLKSTNQLRTLLKRFEGVMPINLNAIK